jgi:hypothetical protein
MVRQRGLADVQPLQKDAGAFFPAAEHLENPEPPFVAEGLEHAGVFRIKRIQAITYIKIFD